MHVTGALQGIETGFDFKEQRDSAGGIGPMHFVLIKTELAGDPLAVLPGMRIDATALKKYFDCFVCEKRVR